MAETTTAPAESLGSETQAPDVAAKGAPPADPVKASAPANETLGGAEAKKEPSTKEGAQPAKTEPSPSPAPIELKLPDGLKVDEKQISGFKQLAAELGLKSEQAQKIFDFDVARQDAANKAVAAEFEQQQSAWAEELKKDAAFGGAKYTESWQSAKRGLEHAIQLAGLPEGGKELKSVLLNTGLGRLPDVVRLFAAIGKATGEDSIKGTARPGGKQTTEAERLHSFYTHPTSKQYLPPKES